MIPVWQIHRLGLFWLLVAYSAVIGIHFEHLPSWVAIAAGIVIIWRIQLYRSVWSPPGKLVKFGLAVLCFAGLLVEYGQLVGLEPMVALLASAFTLKLLEIRHRRDATLVVYLAFFLAALQGLFDQTILSALIILGCFVLITAALVGLHQNSEEQPPLRPLKISVSLLLQAIPLMLLLFIVMPRIGALWAIPFNSHSAKTGVSDTMSPGDFSKLGRSAEVAFRVTFDGEIPAQRDLYWRGLVFSRFDGRQWSSAGPDGFTDAVLLQWYGAPAQPWDELIERVGKPQSYSVILEPTRQPWLYSLATPLPNSKDVAFTRDFRLIARQPIVSKTQYQVNSWLNYRAGIKDLSPRRRSIELSIPKGYNPKTVELAQRWRSETNNGHALIRRALSLYNQKFIYTLRPSLLGKHSVDDFLFETQRGFCEHFSSSFVFLMRAAGIPARVVVGYQGGELHPDNYLVVRQYDAHAWAEVWLPNVGWLRVDPTAAVAPERIESSLADVLGQEEGFLADSPLSLMNFRHISWLNSFRLQMDSMNYAWARWVLGYDAVQDSVLKKWLGDTSPMRIALFLLIVGGGIVALLAIGQLRHSSKEKADQLDQLFLKLCKKLERAGIERRVGEGPQDFANRVAIERPDIAQEIKAINKAYALMRYAEIGQGSERRLSRLKKAVRQISINKEL